MLDTLFRSSLLCEEGRPVSTSVTWVSRNDFENHEIGRIRESRLTLEFDEPIAFEAHNLAKLSGIVNGKTGTLLACRMESNAYIWGVCYFMRGTGPIGEIPAMAMEVRHFSPDYPTVTVTGVGSMQITRGGTVVGRVEGGEFLRAQATVLTSYMLGQYLDRLIGEDADTAAAFKDCVEFIIEVLSQRRAGAAVIFVPPTLKERALAEADTAWKVHGSLEIDQLQRARLNWQKEAQKNQNNTGVLFRLKIDQALRHDCVTSSTLLESTGQYY